MNCTHGYPDDHKIGTMNGNALWVCSCCKSESVWTSGHSSYGMAECHYCNYTTMDWVACSEECCDKLLRDLEGISR